MKGIVEYLNEMLTEGYLEFGKANNDKEKKILLQVAMKEHPELDKNGFMWVGSSLKHNGKKVTKSTRKKIVKPEGMSDMEYISKVVAKENDKFGKAWEEIDGDDTQWKPLTLSNCPDLEELQDYQDKYYISKDGVIVVANPDDGWECGIKKPYWHVRNKEYAVHLYDNNYEGKKRERCQTVRNLIRNAWGKKYAEDFKELEVQEMNRRNR